MSKVLVTGASGFVGKNLVPYLAQNLYNSELIPTSIRYGDPIISKANVYIHLAGIAHDIKKNASDTEYYEANVLLTRDVFDAFLQDDTSECFIYMSSVKAIAENPKYKTVDEYYHENVENVYGKSKKIAEDYIFSKRTFGKRIYILRPCMIHGYGNKGNLNLLYKLVSKKIPWLLGAFDNQRSYCSIDNLIFIIKKLVERKDIISGVYNIADDEALSTNTVISILSESLNIKAKIWAVPKGLIKLLAKIGDIFQLQLTTVRLQKLTESFMVSNEKIKTAIGIPLPIKSRDGLLKTFNSINKSVK